MRVGSKAVMERLDLGVWRRKTRLLEPLAKVMLGPARRKTPPAPSIPGFYVPRWGAYRRRKEAEDKAYWEECFNRALPR